MTNIKNFLTTVTLSLGDNIVLVVFAVFLTVSALVG